MLIAGVDSYLTAATLAAYQERDRLLGSHCQDGFIPGEGAAAVLVTAVSGRNCCAWGWGSGWRGYRRKRGACRCGRTASPER